MPQGFEFEQNEWYKHKGKGPSVIQLFEDVEKMKVRINTIESRLELIGKLNLEIKTLEQKIKLMSTINHND